MVTNRDFALFSAPVASSLCRYGGHVPLSPYAVLGYEKRGAARIGEYIQRLRRPKHQERPGNNPDEVTWDDKSRGPA